MLLFLSCAYISENTEEKRIDPDNDGISWIEDCDNDNKNVGITSWYIDIDGDGYGNPEDQKMQCEPPSEIWVQNGTDCDDQNSQIHIHATEVGRGCCYPRRQHYVRTGFA